MILASLDRPSVQRSAQTKIIATPVAKDAEFRQWAAAREAVLPCVQSTKPALGAKSGELFGTGRNPILTFF
jgi:hypothetical protein